MDEEFKGEYFLRAKEVDENDPAYEYRELFKQKVNFNSSGVHIPVEIYEGSECFKTYDILGNLKLQCLPSVFNLYFVEWLEEEVFVLGSLVGSLGLVVLDWITG